MNKKLLVSFLAIVLLSSLSLASACSNLADQSSFTGEDSNKEIVLCKSIYNQPIAISGAEKLTLNCGGSTLGSGVIISNSLRVTVENCIFSGMGLQLNDVQQSQIRNNKFIGTQNGISATGLSSSSINTNIFEGNMIALKLENSNRNSISLKNIFSSNQFSIDFMASSDNVINKNLFENSIVRVQDKSVNSWDVNGEGNYWSDYFGLDADQNGIGDTPYSIDVANKDNSPFIDKILEKTEGSAVSGSAVWQDKIVGNVVSSVENNEESILKIGDAVEFTCGKNITYKLSLVKTTPELTFDLNGRSLNFAGFAANQLDVNNDKTYDINVIVRSYSLDSANIRIIRLNPCMNYCGDGICSAGETKCTEDCIDQAKLDSDGDGYTIEAGDCDDSSATVYPGAEEQCGNADTDCDGWIGDADTDCQGLGAGFWFLIVFFFIAIIASVVIYFWNGKSEEQMEETFEEEEVVEEIKEPVAVRDVSTKVRRIMDYAENYFTKGYSSTQVKEILAAEGWSSGDINAAINKLVSAGSETVGSRPKEASSLDKLRQTIKKDLESGKSKSDIISALKEKGWEDRVIKVIFKDVETG